MKDWVSATYNGSSISDLDELGRLRSKVTLLEGALKRIASQAKGVHTHNACFCSACEARKALEEVGHSV